MNINVKRYNDNGESTLGLLFIDGAFECYTLEDEARTSKVWGETRIPEGTYEIGFRTEGGHHARYMRKFGDFHKGMLHVKDVPNFEYILIHIGNDDDDTAGCLLVGSKANANNYGVGFVENSTGAYTKLYEKVRNALLNDEQVNITYERIYR
jgi:hypothetical protein